MGGKVYGLAFAYRELYENRFEAIVAALEVLLLAVGLGSWIVLHVFLHQEAPGRMSGWEMALKAAELAVFLLLLLIFLSRIFVELRRTRLGYSYAKLAGSDEDPDPEFIRGFQAQMRQVALGYAPGLERGRSDQPAWSEQLEYIADRIAHQTASLLSERSWFFRDPRWQAREADALADWFRAFPASLWRLPEKGGPHDPADPERSGYFSVIVPMTAKSARSIRKGWRATDLAEVDPRAIEAFRSDRSACASDPPRLDFLAYLHIHVPSAAGAHRDETRLLAVSIQHLAFLLHGFYGSQDRFEEHWDFAVLCESSNKEMNRVLSRLGFRPVEREPDGSRVQVTEARSYAGFRLFELKVEQGSSELQDARKFLGVLRNLVLAYAKQPLPAH
jgi:hypothetical protein